MLCLQGVNRAYYESIILSSPIKLYFCEILKFTKTTNTVFSSKMKLNKLL